MRAAVLVLTAGVILTSCAPSRDEVARVADPSGTLDAAVIEINAGATTSFEYDVYVAPAGQPVDEGVRVASLYGAVRNANAYGVNVRWVGPDTLALEYLGARQARLRRARATLDGQTVYVGLHEGVIDSLAPPGGMLYNLEPAERGQ